MSFPDAYVQSIMVIISNVFVVGAEWSVMPKVEARLVIKVLPKTLRRNGNRCSDEKQKQ